jgi:hypothetical protein
LFSFSLSLSPPPPPNWKRALGIALFLDRESARLQHFDKHERELAIKAFEQSNPFRDSMKSAQARDGKI